VRSRLTPAQALFFGTLTVGVLDLLDAIVFYHFRGVAPIRIPQSIAAGLLGRTAAAQGGLQTAALGVLLHFFISFAVVLVYFRASRLVPFLVRHPWRSGALYGVIVYGIMTFIVVPRSAVGGGVPPLPVAINGILIHIFGVGLPAALFARASSGSDLYFPK
jgi:hypothetical protein